MHSRVRHIVASGFIVNHDGQRATQQRQAWLSRCDVPPAFPLKTHTHTERNTLMYDSVLINSCLIMNTHNTLHNTMHYSRLSLFVPPTPVSPPNSSQFNARVLQTVDHAEPQSCEVKPSLITVLLGDRWCGEVSRSRC